MYWQSGSCCGVDELILRRTIERASRALLVSDGTAEETGSEMNDEARSKLQAVLTALGETTDAKKSEGLTPDSTGDDFPDEELKYLKKRSVDLQGLQIKEGEKSFLPKQFYPHCHRCCGICFFGCDSKMLPKKKERIPFVLL